MSPKVNGREPFFLTILLLAYSNGMSMLAYRRGHDPERAYLFANPAMLLAMLLYAVKRPGGLRATGMRRDNLAGSVAKGLGVGALLSIVPLLFFRKPVVLDTPLEFGPISNMSGRELLLDVAIRVPVNIALMEKWLFAGCSMILCGCVIPSEWLCLEALRRLPAGISP
jgi:hypothetical protein